MKIARLLVPCLLTTLAWSQISAGTVTTNGVLFSYETRLEPPMNGVSRTGGGTLTENNVIKRHVCDFQTNSYFGYDLTANTLPDGHIQLTFSPLTISPSKMSQIFPKLPAWTLLPLPAQPATQTVKAGDTLALDLFVHPTTGQKIVEYITVKGPQGRAIASSSGPARDFAPEDAHLTLRNLRLSINGKPFEHGFERGSISGAPLWMAIANRGRFVFSLLPRTDLGMVKAGEIRGSTMTWRWGGDEYSVVTQGRIGPGDNNAYNLYVYNDPTYRPADTSDPLVIGAGGKLESLVRR